MTSDLGLQRRFGFTPAHKKAHHRTRSRHLHICNWRAKTEGGASSSGISSSRVKISGWGAAIWAARAQDDGVKAASSAFADLSHNELIWGSRSCKRLPRSEERRVG